MADKEERGRRRERERERISFERGRGENGRVNRKEDLSRTYNVRAFPKCFGKISLISAATNAKKSL